MLKNVLHKIIKPALVLYALRVLVAIVIVFPMFVFLSSKFAGSMLADDFWPIPRGLAFLELMWQTRETLYIILPLFFLIAVIYFIINQFFYGGIYDFVLKKDSFDAPEFFKSCSKYIIGFIKIALAGILGFLVVFLAAELMAALFGKIFGWIAGKTIGGFIRYLVIFTGIYIFSGYLVNLRLFQVFYENLSLRFALKKAKDLFSEKLRYFFALNSLAGIFSFFSIIISLYLVSLVYKLSFTPFTLIILILAQQLIILWMCMLEVFQIYINCRFVKEIKNGTEMG